jgi:hypothetical protein
LGAPFDEGREARLQQDLRFLLGMEALSGKHSSTTSVIWRSGKWRVSSCVRLCAGSTDCLQDTPSAFSTHPLCCGSADSLACHPCQLLCRGPAASPGGRH